MSGTIIPGAYNTGVGTLGLLIVNATQVKQSLDRLTEQSSTGLVAQTYGGLGPSAAVTLSLAPQLAANTAYQQNITSATTAISLTTNVLNELGQIANTFQSSLVGADVQSSTGVASLATQAQSALSQVQALLNTQAGGLYLLAGNDTANAPVPDGAFNAYVQSIQTAASGLSSSTGTATAAATLAVATATSPFSASIGSTPTQVTISPGMTVPVGVVAGLNASGAQSGSSTTGSYVLDVIRALATISTFNSASLSQGANFSQLVADTNTSLIGASSAITNDVSSLGATQQQLTNTHNSLTTISNTLTSQISSVDDVNAAATISTLTATQTQLQESYKLISMAQSMSLVSFLAA
jgi:flagellin-like hook-associated protein FlgL